MKRVVVVKGGIDGCPDKLSTGDTASISSPGAALSAVFYQLTVTASVTSYVARFIPVDLISL